MKCPLRNMADRGEESQWVVRTADCLKEECAWWNESYDCCQLVELTHALGGIELHLKEIKEKMPHLEQFKSA